MRPNGNICLGCLLAKCAHVEKAKVECFISFSFSVYHFVLLDVLAQLLTHLLGGRLNLLSFPYRIAFLFFPVQCWFEMIVTMWKKWSNFCLCFHHIFLRYYRHCVYYHSCENVSFRLNKSLNFVGIQLECYLRWTNNSFLKSFFSSLSNLFRITSKQYHIQMKICGFNYCNSFITAMR